MTKKRANLMGSIYKRGKRFWLRVSINGTIYQKSICNPETGVPARTKSEAERFRQKIIDALLNKCESSTTEVKAVTTLKELFDVYWNVHHGNWSEGRVREYERRRKIFESLFTNIDEITPEALANWVEKRKNEVPERYCKFRAKSAL